ncbi:hypothetical protein K523DRAFT_334890 [Schizophyllum commune Tattone D]|nr:hypothetical protein K523DRAFT_334890 [Schizophyllum commune Tattone D]
MTVRSLFSRETDHHVVAQHAPVDTANATTFELEKRDGTKYVFMHHIVGNTYSYTQATWQTDFAAIQATGVDAVALNLGSDSWQPGQIASAYAAAQAVGSIKLFFSFDYSSFACSVDQTVSLVNQYANHPNQFKYNNKVFISSFLGGCLGNSGWQSIKTQTNGYLMPFIEGLEGKFDQWPSLDSWFCWGCSWPQGNYDKNTGDDDYYYSQLGSTPGRYAAGVSPWFYAHYNYKNQYYRGDDWLLNNRWDQLMAMRSRMNFIEIQTWNDWGESHYMGAIRTADQPAGTNWVNGYPHTAWMDMNLYYIQAFKSGAYPAVTSDVIYFWARPHPAGATASSDGLGRPTGYDWATDAMWAVVFSTGQATVTIRCGSSSNTTTVGAGITKLLTPLSPGQMTVTMVRNSQTIINYTPTDYTYVTNPATYNYNAWVGSARAVVTTPTSSSSSSGSTTATSTSSSASSTSTATGFTSVGCINEPSGGRALTGASYNLNNMTIEYCNSLCSGYKYAGTEYGSECYCGNSLANGATTTTVDASQCSSTCPGNSAEKCGAAYKLSLYYQANVPTTTSSPTVTSSATSSATSSSAAPTGTGFALVGCINEPSSGRALTSASYNLGNMTTEYCQSLCRGYKYAGTEYGSECYCGNALSNGATTSTVDSSQCSSACAGNSAEKCGAAYKLMLYYQANPPASTSAAPTSSAASSTATTSRSTTVSSTTSSPAATSTARGFAAVGCVAEASSGRALTSASYQTSNMTVEYCQTLCSGYHYAGVEYGNECYCGNALSNGANGNVLDPSVCSVNCAGNAAEKCGAAYRLNLYYQANIGSGTTSSAPASSTTPTTTSSSSTPSSTAKTWKTVGCVSEASGARALTGSSYTQSNMTPTVCQALCDQGSFTISGTEYGNQCYCGNAFSNGATGAVVAASQCSSKCAGDSTLTCGGPYRLSVTQKS